MWKYPRRQEREQDAEDCDEVGIKWHCIIWDFFFCFSPLTPKAITLKVGRQAGASFIRCSLFIDSGLCTMTSTWMRGCQWSHIALLLSLTMCLLKGVIKINRLLFLSSLCLIFFFGYFCLAVCRLIVGN